MRVGWKVRIELTRPAALFPLWPLPQRQCHNAVKRVALPWRIPKALPPYYITGALRPRNMTQMKEQSKTVEKELSDEEIANLPDGEFKTLVIKMLTEMIELGRKMKEQMKDTQNEIKQNIQEPTVTGMKPGLKAMIWNKSKE